MAKATNPSAKDIIKALGLSPHPEKGHFIETFRDAHSTCIYYLLEGESGLSHWHRVLTSVETWHYYAGAPLQLSLSTNDGTPTQDVILGNDILKGERPQIVVKAGQWQHALSLGDWTLVGCTVSPPFTMDAFEMAAPGWEPQDKSSKK
ncbi:RmlC-like cupin domain-containing protein [Jackrogersella minutella]|nr:RmlC-like cupin domain-containing protein [Jackrogersella minutella]